MERSLLGCGTDSAVSSLDKEDIDWKEIEYCQLWTGVNNMYSQCRTPCISKKAQCVTLAGMLRTCKLWVCMWNYS